MKKLKQHPKFNVIMRSIYDYGLIFVGSVIIAANVPLFLEPNHVVSTGVTGIGMLAYYVWGWPIGLVTLLINIPLLLAGIKWGGGLRFFARTIFAVIVLTVSIDVLSQYLTPVAADPLLYTLFGGLLDGVGIGLVLRGRGTTGGTDIVVQLLARYHSISFGQVLMAVNGVILLGAAVVVGVTPVLYALVVNFVSGRVVDFVQEGVGYARSVLIVSDAHARVRQAIFEQLERGVTVLEARGGYTETPRPALYVVVYRTQITQLKNIIAEIDPNAFVVVSEAHEVLGEGFRSTAGAV
ncbi:MAG TPA: YitT family protein [Anaerolineae bacterium]|nr:YitT family protein [Anaerolineae bacterium]HQH39166.1 YitT family protein [Anaerolineae bacterium]